MQCTKQEICNFAERRKVLYWVGAELGTDKRKVSYCRHRQSTTNIEKPTPDNQWSTAITDSNTLKPDSQHSTNVTRYPTTKNYTSTDTPDNQNHNNNQHPTTTTTTNTRQPQPTPNNQQLSTDRKKIQQGQVGRLEASTFNPPTVSIDELLVEYVEKSLILWSSGWEK